MNIQDILETTESNLENEVFVLQSLQSAVRNTLYEQNIEEFEFEFKQYEDDYYTVMVAFIQDNYEEPISGVEMMVLEALVKEINAFGLEKTVNDLNVNLLKFNNGELSYYTGGDFDDQ